MVDVWKKLTKKADKEGIVMTGYNSTSLKLDIEIDRKVPVKFNKILPFTLTKPKAGTKIECNSKQP